MILFLVGNLALIDNLEKVFPFGPALAQFFGIVKGGFYLLEGLIFTDLEDRRPFKAGNAQFFDNTQSEVLPGIGRSLDRRFLLADDIGKRFEVLRHT